MLSTPFLDPFNDGIRVYIDVLDESKVILHDNGDTVDNLECNGINMTSDRRQKLIVEAVGGCAVRFCEGRLEIQATMANLSQRIHFLITAIMRLNDLWMTKGAHSVGDFYELVQEFFDSNEILYTRNATIPGLTVEHPIDFIIPMKRGKERFVKLVNTPSVQTAKLISFTWFDLKDARPDAEKIVLLNDIDSSDSDEMTTKKVSDQTISILEGYSTGIHRWSHRYNSGFVGLWSNN